VERLKITALAGGVGAAKFLRGLIRTVPQEDVTIIGNVGDDLELYGLHICPDLDTVMYSLAGMVCRKRGWGLEDDTFNCLSMLSRYGLETWFKLGDKDLATHVYRTYLLKSGLRLSRVTSELCRRLGLRVKILPVTDNRLRTMIVTEEGTLSFQEYFVKKRCEPKVLEVFFDGADEAEPAPGVIESIMNADVIIICPSNPILSIQPILAVKGVREALRRSDKPVVAITPIIAGKAVKGPAVKIMRELGYAASASTVAEFYRDFLEIFVLDIRDRGLKSVIESLGLKVSLHDTLMRTPEDEIRLAKEVLNATLNPSNP